MTPYNASTHRTPGSDLAPVTLYSLLCIALLLPAVSAGRVSIGAADIGALILLPLVFAVVTLRARERWSSILILLVLIWALLILHGILFGLLNSKALLESFSFPTEMWQYIKRAMYFLTPVYLIANKKITTRSAVLILLSVLAVTTIIGLVQLGSGSLSSQIATLYARSDAQFDNSIIESLELRRTFGIAGHSTAWGGFSAFVAVTALALAFTPRVERRGVTNFHRAAGAIIFFLALINVAYSGSRAAIVALLIGMTAQLFAGFWAWRSVIGTLFKISAIVTAVTIGVLFFALDRIAFILYRFTTLIETGGGDRVNQVSSGLNLIDSLPILLNGTGNMAQRRFGVSYGIEVEPVYLLVNYGIVGLCLRYLLLVLIVIAAIRVGRYGTDNWGRIAGVATVSAAITYLTFSTGYFFFQEVVTGVAPWVLFGISVGAYELMRRTSLVSR